MKKYLMYLWVVPVCKVMGCPCCGPEWYREFLRKSFDFAGLEHYPESK